MEQRMRKVRRAVVLALSVLFLSRVPQSRAWDSARGRSLRGQRGRWTRTVEDQHRDFFERAVYRNLDPDARQAMLNRFLTQAPARIDAIRQFNTTASALVTEGI